LLAAKGKECGYVQMSPKAIKSRLRRGLVVKMYNYLFMALIIAFGRPVCFFFT
jgi:hypothetical protein